jgi:hypothetical protein
MQEFRCTACGIKGEAKCNCGVPYSQMKPMEAAKLAASKPENKDKNDQELADEIKVSNETVRQARKQLSKLLKVEKRIGKDGRERPTNYKPRRPMQDKIREEVESLIFSGQKASRTKIAEEFGVGTHAVELAIARAQAKHEAQVEAEIDPTTLSQSAQEKLAAALHQHQKKLDAQFEGRVQAEIKERLEEMVYPRLREREKDAARIAAAYRDGIFTTKQYNVILRCLHPDLTPAIEQKNEAFQLWHEAKLLLLSDKEDPREYPSLPTLDELCRARNRN